MRFTYSTYLPFKVLGIFVGSICAGACSSDSADLPKGWDGASRVTQFVQEVCAGSENFANERAAFTGDVNAVSISYEEAHFRCEQDVEGYFKTTDDTLDILVQPIDMHPTAVAGCDCGYNITFTVTSLSAGTRQTTLYRRWDAMNEPNDPVQIATGSVTVK